MSDSWLTDWQIPHDILDCEQCDAVFLHPKEQAELVCPLCGNEQFSEIAADSELLSLHAPELMVPFAKDDFTYRAPLIQFRKSLLLPPTDCTVDNLLARAQRFYWPMWLVDADVTARWQAEVGYEYDAVTYGERYTDGQWRSTEKRERRTRWEPRVGELTRTYENQPAPALDEHGEIVRLLGRYRLGEKRPYSPETVAHNLIRLPTRSPEDAWSDAELVVQQAAAAECHQAAGGQHNRTFKWSPQFGNKHWTHLLLPMIATYYLDDEGEKQMVYLHGQTGKTVGRRVASMKLARRLSLAFGAVTLLLLAITLVLWLLPFLNETAVNPDLIALFGFFTMCAVFTTVAPPLLAFYKNTLQFAAENERLRSSLAKSAEAYWR